MEGGQEVPAKRKSPLVGSIVGAEGGAGRGYRILRRVTRSKYLSVYKAEHRITGIPVFVKIYECPTDSDEARAACERTLVEDCVLAGKCRDQSVAPFMGMIRMDGNKIAIVIGYTPGLIIDGTNDEFGSPPEDSLNGAVIGGEIGASGGYKLLEEIAEGGVGTTYRAEHVLTGLPVCVKICKNPASGGAKMQAYLWTILKEEALAMARCRHFTIPSFIDLFSVGDKDDSIALVMSFIPGKTLEEIVEEYGPLEAEDVAWITERALLGLRSLHWNGVIHGDVKPQNIMVQQESHTVVLVDFGLSKINPKAGSRPKGYTEIFCAPEQTGGTALLPQTDFYCLGLSMLYALSGSDDGEYTSVMAHEAPEDTPEALCEFIGKLLRTNILDRPSWNDDPLNMIVEVRKRAFGRTRSGMKPLLGKRKKR